MPCQKRDKVLLLIIIFFRLSQFCSSALFYGFYINLFSVLLFALFNVLNRFKTLHLVVKV